MSGAFTRERNAKATALKKAGRDAAFGRPRELGQGRQSPLVSQPHAPTVDDDEAGGPKLGKRARHEFAHGAEANGDLFTCS